MMNKRKQIIQMRKKLSCKEIRWTQLAVVAVGKQAVFIVKT